MQSVGSINDIADPDRLSFKVPSGLPDRDYVDLMKRYVVHSFNAKITRACKGVIAPKDQELLYKLLVALSPSRMAGLQRAVHELMCDSRLINTQISLTPRKLYTIGKKDEHNVIIRHVCQE